MMDLQTLVKAFPDPVIVVLPDTQVLYFNDASQGLLDQLKTGGLLSHATRNSELLQAVGLAFEKKSKTSANFTIKKPIKRRINATLIPLVQGREESARHVIFIHMRDMSEQERLAKMRMHFIANASHELRTPLASMSGFIETLQTSAKDDEEARKRFLQIMGTQARRMTRLISDLLSLSRLEMNTDPPPDIQVDIAETVLGVIDALKPQAESNKVRLEARNLSTPAYVRGDKDELVQVFQNIIHNAIRYGSDGGEIQINLSLLAPDEGRPSQISISVTDFGGGIARKHIPRLTERFYRVDKVISRNKGGTGLGLAITKHIIEHHRGKLAINSKPGKGATFSVILNQDL